MQAMQNVFLNSSCVVSGGPPTAARPARSAPTGRFVRRLRASRPVRCSADSERCRCRRTRRRTRRRAPARPSASCRRGTTSRRRTNRRPSCLGAGDGDHRFAGRRAAADHAAPARRRNVAATVSPNASSRHVAGMSKRRGTPRPNASTTCCARKVCSSLRLWFHAMAVQSPSVALERRSARRRPAPACRARDRATSTHAHLVLVDRRELQRLAISGPAFGNCMRSPPP